MSIERQCMIRELMRNGEELERLEQDYKEGEISETEYAKLKQSLTNDADRIQKELKETM